MESIVCGGEAVVKVILEDLIKIFLLPNFAFSGFFFEFDPGFLETFVKIDLVLIVLIQCVALRQEVSAKSGVGSISLSGIALALQHLLDIHLFKSERLPITSFFYWMMPIKVSTEAAEHLPGDGRFGGRPRHVCLEEASGITIKESEDRLPLLS